MEILPVMNIDRGEPFTRSLVISDQNGPIDFTGWTSTVRITDLITREVLLDTTATLNDEGLVLINIPDTTIFSINLKSGGRYTAVCDVNLINPSGVISRIMQAPIRVSSGL